MGQQTEDGVRGQRAATLQVLFGDILAVSRTDLALFGAAALVLVMTARIWRPLLAATVNADLAPVAGLRPARTILIFGLRMATVISVAIKIVGNVLDRRAGRHPAGYRLPFYRRPG